MRTACLPRVDEYVWDLLFHLRRKRLHYEGLTFSLKEYLPFPIFKEAQFRHLKFKEYLMVNC